MAPRCHPRTARPADATARSAPIASRHERRRSQPGGLGLGDTARHGRHGHRTHLIRRPGGSARRSRPHRRPRPRLLRAPGRRDPRHDGRRRAERHRRPQRDGAAFDAAVVRDGDVVRPDHAAVLRGRGLRQRDGLGLGPAQGAGCRRLRPRSPPAVGAPRGRHLRLPRPRPADRFGCRGLPRPAPHGRRRHRLSPVVPGRLRHHAAVRAIDGAAPRDQPHRDSRRARHGRRCWSTSVGTPPG